MERLKRIETRFAGRNLIPGFDALPGPPAAWIAGRFSRAPVFLIEYKDCRLWRGNAHKIPDAGRPQPFAVFVKNSLASIELLRRAREDHVIRAVEPWLSHWGWFRNIFHLILLTRSWY